MNRPVTIYLAGGISNSDNNYDRNWRVDVTRELSLNFSSSNVRVISPMNGKRLTAKDIWKMYGFNTTPNAILHQDLYSVQSSDIVLMNLKTFDEGHPSIGTFSEMGIAIAEHKLLIVVSENPTVVNHPFVQAGATRIVSNLQDGVDYTIGLLTTLVG